MVVAYVDGKPVKELPDLAGPLAALAALGPEVELRDGDGTALGRFTRPPAGPICDWEPDLTAAEVRRRIAAGSGTSLDEFWRKMGVR